MKMTLWIRIIDPSANILDDNYYTVLYIDDNHTFPFGFSEMLAMHLCNCGGTWGVVAWALCCCVVLGVAAESWLALHFASANLTFFILPISLYSHFPDLFEHLQFAFMEGFEFLKNISTNALLVQFKWKNDLISNFSFAGLLAPAKVNPSWGKWWFRGQRSEHDFLPFLGETLHLTLTPSTTGSFSQVPHSGNARDHVKYRMPKTLFLNMRWRYSI